MPFCASEHRNGYGLRHPARLALLWLVPVALVWAAGAALPGLRGDLAALAPARRGSLPHAARGTAVRVLAGEVLVAPRAGRFYPAVPDGAPVRGRAAVARIVGLSAPTLARTARAAERAAAGGAATGAKRSLLAARAAAARRFAASDGAAVVVPAAGTVRWRLPAAGASPLWQQAPALGQWVAAGQRLGVVAPPATTWTVLAPGAALAGLRVGARVRLAALGLRGRVTAIAAGAVVVAAGPSAAGGGGRPLAVTVAWGHAGGVLVPAAAVVRQGASAWVLAAARFAGRLQWRRVSVLATFAGRSAVTGLPPGAWVAARPWLAGLWAAWP